MATRVQRSDVGTLGAPRETPQGFLIVDGYASRVGVYEYQATDGSIRRELRLAADVFAPESLQTFMGAPFTDDHPDDFVDLTNVEGVSIGTVLMPGRQDGDYVAVTCVVTDADAIAALRAGKRELSVGYTVEHDETPGVHPIYGAYDAIQRCIIVNHLALVDEGRAGPVAAVRMDALRARLKPGARIQLPRADAAFQVHEQAPQTWGYVCMSVHSRDLTPRDLAEYVRRAVASIPGAQIESATDSRRRRDAGTINVGWAWGAEVYVTTADMSAADLSTKLGDALEAIEGVVVNRCDDGSVNLGTALATGADIGQLARSMPMPKRDNDPANPAADLTPPGAPAPAAPPPPAATAAPAPAGSPDAGAMLQQLLAASSRIEELLKQLAAAEQAEQAAEARATEAEATAQNATAEVAMAQQAAADAKKNVDAEVAARVDARVKLLTAANAVLGASDKAVDRSALADRDIQVAIIKHVDGIDVPETEKREPYIAALLDGAISRHARGRAAGETVATALDAAGKKVDLNTPATNEAAAAAKQRDTVANRWRQQPAKKGN